MLTDRIGTILSRPLDALVRALARISPDVLTITGLVLNGVACASFALAGGPGYVSPAMLRIGGLVAIAGAAFDMLDGRVARLRGRETRFGAYLDSTMDRYSDALLYLGLMILYARLDETLLMVLVWVAAFGGFMTSYARARAESLIPKCTVGLMERPERLVLLIVGALFNKMVAALWIIAILANITAIQRVVYTYVELKRGWAGVLAPRAEPEPEPEGDGEDQA